MEQNGIWHGSAGRDYYFHLLICPLWISRITRRKLCLDCLCECLSEMSLPGRFHSRPAEQPADGILFGRHHRQRCPTAWLESEASRCAALGVVMHPGTSGLLENPPLRGAAAFRPRGMSGCRIRPGLPGGHPPAPPSKGESAFSPLEMPPTLRLGLKIVRGLRQNSVDALIQERERDLFRSIDDLAQRVPCLQKDELKILARIGALNSLEKGSHRRDALWQVEQAARPVGPLLKHVPEEKELSPLSKMSDEERLISDFYGTGLTIGKHPIAYRRPALERMKIKRACELKNIPDGRFHTDCRLRDCKTSVPEQPRDSSSSVLRMRRALPTPSLPLTSSSNIESW